MHIRHLEQLFQSSVATLHAHNKSRCFKRSLLFVCSVVVTACATTSKTDYITHLESDSAQPRVILMPLDVELSLLTAGGVTEPKADWTESAIGFMQNSLAKHSNVHDFEAVNYNPSDHPHTTALAQVQKLHEAVGLTMLQQRVQPLPSKANDFSWSLGNSAASLGEAYDADYALYLFVRDSYASAGRKALIVASVLASAFTGGPAAQGGHQVGYASLVDLKSGDIVWFNSLAREAGDLRDQKSADSSVLFLLQGFPKNSSTK